MKKLVLFFLITFLLFSCSKFEKTKFEQPSLKESDKTHVLLNEYPISLNHRIKDDNFLKTYFPEGYYYKESVDFWAEGKNMRIVKIISKKKINLVGYLIKDLNKNLNLYFVGFNRSNNMLDLKDFTTPLNNKKLKWEKDESFNPIQWAKNLQNTAFRIKPKFWGLSCSDNIIQYPDGYCEAWCCYYVLYVKIGCGYSPVDCP